MIVLLRDNEITENTPLGGNIDVDRLRQCIIDAQITRLEELLGEDLYDKICNEYDAETLEGDYLTLYENYIKPFLIRQGALEFLKIGAFTIGNNGIALPTPTNTSAIDSKMLSNLVSEMRAKADMFAERMYRWLCKKNLPEWRCSSDNVVNPNKPSFGSWFLTNEFIDEDIYVRNILNNKL
jgi:hypothetical protein